MAGPHHPAGDWATRAQVSGAVIAERAGRDAWWNNALMGAKKEAVFGIREHNGDVMQVRREHRGLPLGAERSEGGKGVRSQVLVMVCGIF